jgi:hypothetical protein
MHMEARDFVRARRHYAEAVTLASDMGDRRECAGALSNLVRLAVRDGSPPERAARLLGAFRCSEEGTGLTIGYVDPEDEEVMRAALGPERFEMEKDAGRAMTWEQAVDYALDGEPS